MVASGQETSKERLCGAPVRLSVVRQEHRGASGILEGALQRQDSRSGPEAFHDSGRRFPSLVYARLEQRHRGRSALSGREKRRQAVQFPQSDSDRRSRRGNVACLMAGHGMAAASSAAKRRERAALWSRLAGARLAEHFPKLLAPPPSPIPYREMIHYI